MIWKLLYLLAFSIISSFCQKAPNTLRFINIWFRHGERMPTNFARFKSEPPLEFDFADLAYPGEVTNRGLWQEYNFGRYLRGYYDEFLGSIYRPPQIYVSYGVDNRTSVSAEAMLAGLFPPKAQQVWNQDLLWQPVALHMDETIDQISTGIVGVCPNYQELIWNDRRYKEIEQVFDPIVVQLLRNETGEYLPDGYWINKALDTVKTRYYINDSRYEVPSWAKPYMKEFMHSSVAFHNAMLKIQNDTVGGFHLEMIMSGLEEHFRVSGDKEFQKKAVFYSAHDTNIMAIMMALSIAYVLPDLPYFAAHLDVELHEFDGEYFVEFWLAENVALERMRLIPKYCTNPCSYNQLQKITKPYRVDRAKFNFICNGQTKGLFEEKPAAIITGSMIILLAILLLSTIILSCTTYSYRKQLKQMQDPERMALLS